MREEKAQPLTTPLQLTLEDVRKRFETWRETRKRCHPIPRELWDAAVDLTKIHSINMVSRALRLNYTALKKHAHDKLPKLPARNLPKPFIELGFCKPDLAPHCVVEMEKPGGARMKISFSCNAGIDPLAFSKMFWDNPA